MTNYIQREITYNRPTFMRFGNHGAVKLMTDQNVFRRRRVKRKDKVRKVKKEEKDEVWEIRLFVSFGVCLCLFSS